jgi:hypothetical protein
VSYHRVAPWWKSNYGRALFVLGFVTFSFFTTSMLFNLFGPDYPGRTTLRVVNMLLSVSMIWYLWVTLVVDGTSARRRKRQAAQPGEAEEGL